jgi:chromosome segregation ATPase
LDDAKKELEAKKTQVRTLSAVLAEAQDTSNSMEDRTGDLERERAAHEEDRKALAKLQEELKVAQKEAERSQKEVRTLQDAFENAQQRTGAVQGQVESVQAGWSNTTSSAELATLKGELAKARAALEVSRAEVSVLQGMSQDSTGNQASPEAMLQTPASTSAPLQLAKAKLQAENMHLMQKVAEMRSELQRLMHRCEEAERSSEAAQAKLEHYQVDLRLQNLIFGPNEHAGMLPPVQSALSGLQPSWATTHMNGLGGVA